MKLNRTITIEALREHIKKCNLKVAPQFEDYCNKDLLKVCRMYGIQSFWFE